MDVKGMVIAGALATTLTTSLVAAQNTNGASDAPAREYVRTTSGVIHGRSTGKVVEFLGVPFAAPPVGDLRWRAPQPVVYWQGVRETTVPSSGCVRPAKSADGYMGSEDCLYLNVYRPAHATPGQRLPVMVFVHGGSNLKQAASDYDPAAFVEQTGVLLVTTDYRLNVFGFLALPSLDTEAGDTSSGNFGLQDQQAALRWVLANIARFGGDPFNVTLAGESAGAIDLCANLVSPAAAGLFNKAIMESMYCPTATHDEALAVGAPVAAKLNCTDPQTASNCLRAAPAAQVFAAAKPYSIEPGGGSGFNASPNFGSKLLPLQVRDAITSGRWNSARILVGSNRTEAALFTGVTLTAVGFTLPPGPLAYKQLVMRKFGSLSADVMAEYQRDLDDTNTFIAYSDEVSDTSPLGCEVTQWSQLFAQATPTFRYEFADANAPVPPTLSSNGFPLGAYHGSELQYLYGPAFLPGPQSDTQKKLAQDMTQYWGNFVKTGNPNGRGLTHWPRYDARDLRILKLAPEGSAVIDNFEPEHHCAFWEAHPQSAKR
jgi:para-nitrobenzyl esterase